MLLCSSWRIIISCLGRRSSSSERGGIWLGDHRACCIADEISMFIMISAVVLLLILIFFILLIATVLCHCFVVIIFINLVVITAIFHLIFLMSLVGMLRELMSQWRILGIEVRLLLMNSCWCRRLFISFLAWRGLRFCRLKLVFVALWWRLFIILITVRLFCGIVEATACVVAALLALAIRVLYRLCKGLVYDHLWVFTSTTCWTLLLFFRLFGSL